MDMLSNDDEGELLQLSVAALQRTVRKSKAHAGQWARWNHLADRPAVASGGLAELGDGAASSDIHSTATSADVACMGVPPGQTARRLEADCTVVHVLPLDAEDIQNKSLSVGD